VKGKWLGDLLQAARAAPRGSWGLDRRSNPERWDDVVGRLLGRLGESYASRDTATLSQRGARSLVGLVVGNHLPQVGGERKGRWARKYQGDVGEGKIAIVGRHICDWSSPHRAWSGKRLVLGGRCTGR
jgi:hypothetical protein